MRRRYTIHKDGDLLVEDLDAAGRVLESDPVPAEDRLPIEVVVGSEDDPRARAALIDLLELALELETETQENAGEGFQLPVLK